MEIKAYFDDIENIIINELMLARKSIKIAVAWFTDAEFIPTLVRKVRGGVEVEILLHHDEINHLGDTSIDFTEFIKHGGKLVWCKGNHSTMHEKFCIIDDEVLIEGTFNWTYYAEVRNDEHIIIFKECSDLVSQFVERYNNLKEKYKVGTPVNISGLQNRSKATNYTPIIAKNPETIPRKRNNHGEHINMAILKPRKLEFFRRVEALDKQGKSKDYIDEFCKYWTRVDMSIDGGYYLFEKEVFDLQEKFIEFEEKYKDILAEREQEEQEKILNEYANNFRKNYIIINPEPTDYETKRNDSLRLLTNEFNSYADKLRNLPKDEFCVNSGSCKDDNAWDYLNRIGIPYVVDKDDWYHTLLYPQKGRCYGENLTEKIDIGDHIKNIINIENIIGKHLVVRDKLRDVTNDNFQRERALYIKMIEDGYSHKQIQDTVYKNNNNMYCYQGGDGRTINAETFKDIIYAACGLKTYSFKILREIEKKNIKVKDLYDVLGIDCPKSLEDKYWWSHTRKDVLKELPINIFTESPYSICVHWNLHPIDNNRFTKALETLCNIDLSVFKGNDPEGWRHYGPWFNYWIPEEVIKEPLLFRGELENHICHETEEELLARPIDFYYELFEDCRERMNTE